MSKDVGVWIAALSTLFMYSYLYKDNTLFKFGEHLFIGVASAHHIVMGYQNIMEMGIRPLGAGRLIVVVPIALGLMLFTRFGTGKTALLCRIPIGFLAGLAAALSIRGLLDASLVQQIASTMKPIKGINDVLLLVGVLTTISYFLFTNTGKNPVLKGSANIGRMVMMITFGAAFGNTVMARMSLVIGRLQFLFGTWIPLIK